jgi:hypothetical protein
MVQEEIKIGPKSKRNIEFPLQICKAKSKREDRQEPEARSQNEKKIKAKLAG